MSVNSLGIIHRRNFSSAVTISGGINDNQKSNNNEILHHELRRLLIRGNNQNNNEQKQRKRPVSARCGRNINVLRNHKKKSFAPICAKWGKMLAQSKLDVNFNISNQELNLRVALTVAVSQNDIELLSKLCGEYGGDPNEILTQKNETPLILAAKNGDAGMMEQLVKYGYDIKNNINKCDIDKRTAGHHASMYNGRGSKWHVIKLMFQFLLKYDCNFLMFDSKGYLVLHYLCRYNRHEGLDYLISKNIYGNNMLLNQTTINNNYNATSIMIAIEKRSVQCLNILCDVAINKANDIKPIVDVVIGRQMFKFCIVRSYHDVLDILLSKVKQWQDKSKSQSHAQSQSQQVILTFDMLVDLYEYANNCKNITEKKSCLTLLAKWLHEERSHWQPQEFHSSQHKLVELEAVTDMKELELETKMDTDNTCIVCNGSNRLCYCNKCKFYVCQSCINNENKSMCKKSTAV